MAWESHDMHRAIICVNLFNEFKNLFEKAEVEYLPSFIQN